MVVSAEAAVLVHEAMNAGIALRIGRHSNLLGLISTVVLAPACSTWHQHDPVHDGKRLSVWMAELNREWKEDEPFAQVTARMEAWTNVVQAVGTNGLPLYLRRLQESPRLPSTYGAQLAIQILGPRAQPAIPELARLLHKDESAYLAAECLLAIGPSAVPALTEAVTTTTNPVRYAVIMILGELGPAASSASEALIRVIETDPRSAEGAMRAVVEVETNTAVLLPLLCEHVSDTNNSSGAMHALGRLGNPGIPILLQALTNQQRNIRCFAEGALDSDFQKHSLGHQDVPRFRTLTCIYNLKALSAAVHSYSQGDFRFAAEVAERFTNNPDGAIRSAASNALIHLQPLAMTNVPRMKLDEANDFLPPPRQP